MGQVQLPAQEEGILVDNLQAEVREVAVVAGLAPHQQVYGVHRVYLMVLEGLLEELLLLLEDRRQFQLGFGGDDPLFYFLEDRVSEYLLVDGVAGGGGDSFEEEAEGRVVKVAVVLVEEELVVEF